MALFGRKKETEEAPKKEAVKKAAPKAKTSAKAKGETLAEAVAASRGLTHAEVLVRPRITEKATFATERGVYVFDISPRATKTDVVDAVKHYYKVTPRKVNIVTIPQKKVRSRMRGRFGTVAGGKKAYIYLKEGDTIDVV